MPSNKPISAEIICNAIRTGKYFHLDLNGISQNVIDSAVYDLNISSNGTITPLHYAALKGRFDIVADLMSRGADPSKIVNHQNLCGRLWYKDKPKFLHLLNHFFGEKSNKIVNIEEIRNNITASVNAGFTDGSTLLIRAIKHGRQDLVNALIKAGADVSAEKICDEIRNNTYKGRFDIVANLISIGANPQEVVNRNDLCSILWRRDKPNFLNLLNYFFGEKSNKIVNIEDIRTKITASVNARFKDGSTLLIEAIEHGHMDLFNALIKAGADVNKTNHYNGITALDIAISQNKPDIARLLLEKEGIVVPDFNNILHEAIKNNLPLDIIEKLINQGANIEFRDKDKNTPLILAAKKARVEIIELLIKKKASTDAVNNDKMNWEMAYRMAYRKQDRIFITTAIVAVVALIYAITGAICTNHLFHSFEPSACNIFIILASLYVFFYLIWLVVTNDEDSDSECARDDCDVFIPKIKKLIQEQQPYNQKSFKGHTTPSAPPGEVINTPQVRGKGNTSEDDSDNNYEPGLNIS